VQFSPGLPPRSEITPWHKAGGRNSSTLQALARHAQGHLLCLSFPICTFAAWTENSTRSFSSFAKHPFQEGLGLVDPLIGDLTPT
jgi:hypothetical protein